MALRVEEVLALWREAERVLDGLPVGDPERTHLNAEIVEIREIYARLTEAVDSTWTGLGSSREQMASASETLVRVRASLAKQVE
ncbi:MAG TPA: hypothetical protein VGO64_08140 [Candidatus Limnocylindrales bacterium]|jgi:hypothetical protein|nr:hypothetical protein [Candidatus Limnocylindrales bacterium]